MESIAFLIVGVVVGYLERSGREKVKDLYQKLSEREKPAVGATNASYGQVNEYSANQTGDIGISEPKTPQMLAWEESQRLKQLNEIVKQ